jgi:hypothetical protein
MLDLESGFVIKFKAVKKRREEAMVDLKDTVDFYWDPV